MRKISLVVAAALILAGVGAWAAPSITHSLGHIPTAARLDPSQMMMNAKGLPVDDFVDYTFVFSH